MSTKRISGTRNGQWLAILLLWAFAVSAAYGQAPGGVMSTLVPDGMLLEPSSVAIDSAGNLYIADPGNYVVRKVNAKGEMSVFAGTVGSSQKHSLADAVQRKSSAGCAPNGDGCAANKAVLTGPRNLAIDDKGNVYIADFSASRIRKVAAATGIISTYVGGELGPGGWSATRVHNPEGIAVDGAGNIYIADKKNNAIRKVRPPESPNATGIMTTIAGLGPDAAGCIAEDTKASEAPLSAPQEVAVDAAGNLYIADAGCRKIRKIGKDGIMHTLVGSGAGRTGTPAYVAYNGPTQEAGEINLGNPVGVKADAAGNLYISDPAFGAIWFYDTVAKKVSLLAGGPVAGGKGICPERSNDFGDGCPGLQAKLNIPFRVALDTKGNLYIPEQGDLAMPMHPYAIRVLQAKQQGKGTGKSNR